MLIEQIIEFKLRGPGPLGRTYTPTKIYNMNNFDWIKIIHVIHFFFFRLKFRRLEKL